MSKSSLPMAVALGLVCLIDPFYPAFNSGLSLVMGGAVAGGGVTYLLTRSQTAQKILGFDISGIITDVTVTEGAVEGAIAGLLATLGTSPGYRAAIGFSVPIAYDQLL